jgi:hypothetical protein
MQPCLDDFHTTSTTMPKCRFTTPGKPMRAIGRAGRYPAAHRTVDEASPLYTDDKAFAPEFLRSP